LKIDEQCQASIGLWPQHVACWPTTATRLKWPHRPARLAKATTSNGLAGPCHCGARGTLQGDHRARATVVAWLTMTRRSPSHREDFTGRMSGGGVVRPARLGGRGLTRVVQWREGTEERRRDRSSSWRWRSDEPRQRRCGLAVAWTM
jgi:hypothetical protein